MNASVSIQPPMTLPFGKHKGKPLAEVPSDNLLWMLGSSGLMK